MLMIGNHFAAAPKFSVVILEEFIPEPDWPVGEYHGRDRTDTHDSLDLNDRLDKD